MGLVDDSIKKRMEAVIREAAEKAGGEALFNGDLTEQEQDDLAIEKAQLQMAKEKELKAIDVQVEEELDAQAARRKQEREDRRMKLAQQMAQT